MSLLTRAYLLERYGPRLTVAQIAEMMGYHVHSIHNMLARNEFPIPVYRENGRIYAGYEDVADYFDKQRDAAREELEKEKARRTRAS